MTLVRSVIFAVLLFPVFAFAGAPRGVQLVQRLWEDMKAGNVSKIEHYTSWKFQSVHETGRADRSGELDIIKNLNMTDYTLSDIKATMTHNVIIVSYTAQVTRIISGQTITTIAPRLSTFSKINGKWLWTSHANLAALPQ